MDEKELTFCTRCGAKISSDAAFCPECHAQVAVIPQKTAEEYFQKDVGLKQSNTMLWTKILLFVYGGLALISGIMLAGMSGWSLSVLESSDPEYLKSLLDSLGMTKQQYLDFCNVAGIAYLISGALALISGVMCAKRRYNKIAVVLCVIASIVSSLQLIAVPADQMASNAVFVAVTVIVGLIVACLIYKVRNEFED